MELINNTSKTLKDDLSVEIKKGSKLSIAAACFSIYAFQELKKQLTSKLVMLKEKILLGGSVVGVFRVDMLECCQLRHLLS